MSKYVYDNDEIKAMIILCNKGYPDDLEIDTANKKITSRGAKISTKEHGRYYQGDKFDGTETWDDSKDHAWENQKRLLWNNCGIRFFGRCISRLEELEELLNDGYELIFDEETNKLLKLLLKK